MKNLLQPLETRNLKLENRLVFPPMATSKAKDDGRVSKDIVNYYDEKSSGGFIGLIIVEHSYTAREGMAGKNQVSLADDYVIEGIKEIADVIHKNGSKAIMQINHAGNAASSEITGCQPVGPSAVPNPRRGEVPRELSREEIKEIIKGFKDASIRVKKAGFDGVEIHSAHGYLLNQFFSPLTNKREDEYGGDVIGRIKIHLDIIKEVRDAVGEDFTILLRLGASDFMEGGITIEDSKIAAVEFEKTGVDILDVSGGFCGHIAPGLTGQGYFSPLTKALKEVVSIPVILTGGIIEAKAAEELLAEGNTDLIGVGRAIYNDSTWAKRAIEELKSK